MKDKPPLVPPLRGGGNNKNSIMKKQEAINFWKKFWVQSNIVEEILMKKTGLNKSQFFLSEELKISKNDLEELKELFKKIAFWYPIEYALEKAEFYWLDFYVDKRCLIPRNDTEIMVDKAIEEIKKKKNVVYIDVWTGSWAIPISVVDNVWHLIDKAFAVDISEDALEVAKKNIKTHNLVDKIELLKSDLLTKIPLNPPFTKRKIAECVITANLPYIKNEDFWNMDKEVILHEPAIALYWWKKTGFELYEKLIKQILNSPLLQRTRWIDLKGQEKVPWGRGVGGEVLVLFIEIWFDQKEIAINYLENKNLKFEIFKDNWGVDRCVKIIF